MDWPEKHKEVVVRYYDVARARALEWTEERLVEAKAEEGNNAPPSGLVDYSSVDENRAVDRFLGRSTHAAGCGEAARAYDDF